MHTSLASAPGSWLVHVNQDENRRRAASAAAVIAWHVLLFYLLVTSFAPAIVTRAVDGLKIFDLARQPPPQPARPAAPRRDHVRKTHTPNPEGAASPRNLKDTPSQIVAPLPKLPVPPPIVAAPVAAEGRVAAAGASTVPGPGTGSGGIGSGTGSGLEGDGTGGGGGGTEVHVRWIKGRIKDSDYPRSAYEAHAGGTVEIRFVVGTSGRVTDCRVTRTSGRRDLDTVTCALIVQRFRYRPARDFAGRAVPEVVDGEQVWELASGAEDRPEDDDDSSY